MDDDDIVKIIAKFIFNKQAINTKEIIVRHPSIPTYLLTDDFYVKLQAIMYIKKRIVACRWRNFIDNSFKKMFSSCEMYLTFVFYACYSEHKCHQNIFESFLSVCAVLELLSDETNLKIQVNFCDLNPDIFKVFYLYDLKPTFSRRGGSQRLLEYIRNHRYLGWKQIKDFFTSPGELNAILKTIEMDLNTELKKELKRDCVIEKETNSDEVANNFDSTKKADAVLEITLVKLPILPSYRDLIKSLITYKKKEIENNAEKEATKTAEKSEVLHRCSSLSSESKTNYAANNQENIEQYENIIQAVMRHNQSKSSGHENANNRIQEKADGILQHLNDTIKSLMEVLNEHDKE